MKKTFALMLAAAMALSLAACGGGGTSQSTPNTSASAAPTKEEMLENAQSIKIADIYEDIRSNKLKAEDTYKGNTYIFTGEVETIESDYIEIYNSIENSYPSNCTTKVYMSTDDIKELETGYWIEIVGEVSSIDLTSTSKDLAGGAVEVEYIGGLEISPAYFVTDNFELSGKLARTINSGNIYAWGIALDRNALSDPLISALNEKNIILDDLPCSKDSTVATISGTEFIKGSKMKFSGKILFRRYLLDYNLISDN